ncbi:MAG: FAD synthetase family protein [Clostridia bacterium]
MRDGIEGSVIALGMFDGMHIGHREVIGSAVALAKQCGLQSVVYTFENHPRSVFAEAPALLMTAEKRKEAMLEMGVDQVDMVRFTRELASLSPHAFLEALVSRWAVKAVVAGSDFTFGYKGEGTVETLRALAGEFGYRVLEVPFVMLDGEKVSSTRIRKALEEGRNALAEQMLGKH